MNKEIHRFWALREQAEYLRHPLRNSGPSIYEAQEAADRMEREADDLSEALFDSNQKKGNV